MKTFKMTELYKSPQKVLPQSVEDGGVLLTHKSFDQPFLLVPLKHHTKAIEKYKEIQESAED